MHTVIGVVVFVVGVVGFGLFARYNSKHNKNTDTPVRTDTGNSNPSNTSSKS